MLADPLREALCEHQENSAVIDTPLQKGARGWSLVFLGQTSNAVFEVCECVQHFGDGWRRVILNVKCWVAAKPLWRAFAPGLCWGR